MGNLPNGSVENYQLAVDYPGRQVAGPPTALPWLGTLTSGCWRKEHLRPWQNWAHRVALGAWKGRYLQWGPARRRVSVVVTSMAGTAGFTDALARGMRCLGDFIPGVH